MRLFAVIVLDGDRRRHLPGHQRALPAAPPSRLHPPVHQRPAATPAGRRARPTTRSGLAAGGESASAVAGRSGGTCPRRTATSSSRSSAKSSAWSERWPSCCCSRCWRTAASGSPSAAATPSLDWRRRPSWRGCSCRRWLTSVPWSGLLPITGIPLPLMSAGGSALIPTMFALGVLMSLARREPSAAAALRARGPNVARRACAASARCCICPRPTAPLPVRAPSVRLSCQSARPPAMAVGEVVHVVLAGGGTAGHVEPALAVADALRRRDPDVGITMLGTARGLENRLVPARGYDLALIPPVPLPRSLTPSLLTVPARMRTAVHETTQILDLGGCRRRRRLRWLRRTARLPCRPRREVAVRRARSQCQARPGQPVGRAIHARSSPPASTTRGWRTPRCSAFRFGERSARSTGPRPAAEARAQLGLLPDAPTLLVSGGSQGARSLNRAVVGAIGDLLAAGVQVLHVAGPAQVGDVEAARPEAVEGQPPYLLVPYLDRMDFAYAAADLMLCRAGAMTCAELTVVGLPAVYVPLPHGNGEQRFNAQPIVDAGGGLVVSDAKLRPDWIRDNLIPLITNPRRLRTMSARGRRSGSSGRRRETGRHDRRSCRDTAQRRRTRRRAGADARPERRADDADDVAGRQCHRRRASSVSCTSSASAAAACRASPASCSPAASRSPAAMPAKPAYSPPCACSAPRCRSATTPATSAMPTPSSCRRRSTRTIPNSSRRARRGLRILPRAAALAAVMAGRRGVAVAGTHGKTTTTSMLARALQHCGEDPSFAIGADLNEPGSNAHDGGGDLFIAEADESDESLPAAVAVRRDRHQRRSRPPQPLRRASTTSTRRSSALPMRIAAVRLLGRVRRRRRARQLARFARSAGIDVRSYGESPDADVRITELDAWRAPVRRSN